MGLIEFDGETVLLTTDGESLLQPTSPAGLPLLLEKNSVGITELLAFVKERPH